MRLAHLREAHLNVFIVFAVVREERKVSRAAARLREMFHDDLLPLLVFVGFVRNSENQSD
jgi:hypothetical protein